MEYHKCLLTTVTVVDTLFDKSFHLLCLQVKFTESTGDKIAMENVFFSVRLFLSHCLKKKKKSEKMWLGNWQDQEEVMYWFWPGQSWFSSWWLVRCCVLDL